MAEVGGGKLLSRDFAADNPFESNRKKTFQPVDLWEWLLKFAIILFPIDVGVRRIQIDWNEWLKATNNLRQLFFFWRRSEMQTSTDEALASLLARRDEAQQSFQRDKLSTPDPRLFQREQPAPEFSSNPSVVAEAKPEESSQADRDDSTTSRLLAAKRNARRHKK